MEGEIQIYDDAESVCVGVRGGSAQEVSEGDSQRKRRVVISEERFSIGRINAMWEKCM